MQHVANLCILGLAAVGLSACASASDRYPSLAMRDAERMVGEAQPAVPPPVPIAPVASEADIAGLRAEASGFHDQFRASQGEAVRLARAARMAGRDADIRSRALVALADLTSLRSQTLITLAALDALQADAATTFAPTALIASAQTAVTQMVDEQNSGIDLIEQEMGL